MRITGARWRQHGNQLLIRCDCGNAIIHQANTWRVYCSCGRTAHLGALRVAWARDHGVTA